MAAYGQAKAKLFAWPGLHSAVINADDAFGQGLIDAARARGRRVISYGLGAADVAGSAIAMSDRGLTLAVTTPWGRGTFTTGVVGAFNAQNVLGVLAVLLESEIRLTDALDALTTLTPPAGRMQRIGGDGKPLAVVDYAHTPDALEKALSALKPAVAPGHELCVVFGCGGDRDKGKRPEMGRVAGTLADRVVVTNDNARGEDPQEIASAIVRGLRQTGSRRWTVELDRAQAIRGAIAGAKPGDVVLIAGKGHETYQEVQGERRPFSDATEATAALAARSEA
jgi:UDP-N-acetylmuramoyl-L-alanyl-D-glutamate--2,6-diaminopimelate ligase